MYNGSRRFATSPTTKQGDEASPHRSQLICTYRVLLRRTPASVRFNRPASQNLARLLRNEVQAQLVSDASSLTLAAAGATKQSSPGLSDELQRLRARTLTLLLASSHSPRRTVLPPPPSPAPPPSSSPAPQPFNDQSGDVENALDAHRSGLDNAPQLGRLRQTLAHRLVANLASLTYHHLSPHTQMQRLSKRHKLVEHKPKPLSSLARMLHKNDGDGESTATAAATSKQGAVSTSDWLAAETDEAGIINATADRLEMLRIPPKPVLGPVGGRLRSWDAQNPDKFRDTPTSPSASSAGGLMVAERDIEILNGGLHDLAKRKETLQKSNTLQDRKAKLELKQIEKQQAKIEVEIRELEKRIKTLSRNAAKQAQAKRVQSVAVDLLADVVSQAQTNEKLWIGKTRWDIRRRDGWLSP